MAPFESRDEEIATPDLLYVTRRNSGGLHGKKGHHKKTHLRSNSFTAREEEGADRVSCLVRIFGSCGRTNIIE